jgi:hypothetical protein
VKKGRWAWAEDFDSPEGIISHLSRECGGNVHDRNVVAVTSSKPFSVCIDHAAKNAVELEGNSCFLSGHRDKKKEIPHARNNWICYDFKSRRIVPTYYAIRSGYGGPGGAHLKSWIVETSTDGENWKEIDRKKDNAKLNGWKITGTFPVTGAGECRFIRLVNIGRNHAGYDMLAISAWEIFGSLIE